MRRYDDRQVGSARFLQLNRIWRAKLEKLCRLRFGNHYLPDSHDGRAMLVALLSFGMTDDSAIIDASWCEAELPLLKRRAKQVKWCDVGKLIGLTFAEWQAAKLWVMRPIDKTEAELDQWRKDRRKESSSKSKQKARAKKREKKERITEKAKAYPPREAAIIEMLLQKKQSSIAPLEIPELTKFAKKSDAFKRPGAPTRLNGPKPQDIVRGVRWVVHRTLKRLVAKGVIRLYGSMVILENDRHTGTENDRHSVTGAFPAKVLISRAFLPQPTLSAGKVDTVVPSVSNQSPAVVVPFKRRKVR
jgi:hypothetical protein